MYYLFRNACRIDAEHPVQFSHAALFHKHVGNRRAQHRGMNPLGGKVTLHLLSESAGTDILLHCHHQAVFPGKSSNRVPVKRLDKTGVHHRRADPLLSQQPLREYCQARGIQLEAYSPVARMHEKLIQDPRWPDLVSRYGKSIPQLILRWDFQHGVIPVPKASSLRRLRENLSIFDFELSEKDMAVIDGMNCDFRVRYDPDHCDMTRL